MKTRTLAVPLLAIACLLAFGGTSGAVTAPFVTVGAAGDIAWSSGPQTAAQQTAAANLRVQTLLG